MADKHRVEVDLLNKQVKAFVARNDQLSKQNDTLLRRVRELESGQGIPQTTGGSDVFGRLADESSKIDADYNYLEI